MCRNEEPEPHKIFVTIVGPCLQRTVDFAAGVEEGFFHFPSSPKRSIPVKKQFGYLTIKFDQGLIFKPFPPHFTLDTRQEIPVIVLKLSCIRSPTPV